MVVQDPGKSFFTKLQILRQNLLGIKQYIIDPEREYNKLCNNLDGMNIKIGPDSNSYLNIFDIRKTSSEEGKGFLNSKLIKLKSFFYLVFENMTQEEYGILEKIIIEIYKEKGINFSDQSLYYKSKFKSPKQMPRMQNLYENIEKRIEDITDKQKTLGLKEYEILIKFKNKLEIFVNGSLSFFNKKTNIDFENSNLIVADIYSIGEENYKYAMFLFTEIFWDEIKKDRDEKKLIYIDEIWRIIGVTSNKETASFIFKIFKTIRKYSGGAVAITQDISDIFTLDEGRYGKSILNNSEIKAIFYLEEDNINILSEYINLSEKEKIEIRLLQKGENLLLIGGTHILLEVLASDFEKEMVEKEYEDFNSNK